jgi:hypothetical protein
VVFWITWWTVATVGQLVQNRASAKSDQEGITAARIAFRAKIEEKKRAHLQDVAAFKDQYANLTSQLNSYHDSLKQAMSAAK